MHVFKYIHGKVYVYNQLCRIECAIMIIVMMNKGMLIYLCRKLVNKLSACNRFLTRVS